MPRKKNPILEVLREDGFKKFVKKIEFMAKVFNTIMFSEEDPVKIISSDPEISRIIPAERMILWESLYERTPELRGAFISYMLVYPDEVAEVLGRVNDWLEEWLKEHAPEALDFVENVPYFAKKVAIDSLTLTDSSISSQESRPTHQHSITIDFINDQKTRRRAWEFSRKTSQERVGRFAEALRQHVKFINESLKSYDALLVLDGNGYFQRGLEYMSLHLSPEAIRNMLEERGSPPSPRDIMQMLNEIRRLLSIAVAWRNFTKRSLSNIDKAIGTIEDRFHAHRFFKVSFAKGYSSRAGVIYKAATARDKRYKHLVPKEFDWGNIELSFRLSIYTKASTRGIACDLSSSLEIPDGLPDELHKRVEKAKKAMEDPEFMKQMYNFITTIVNDWKKQTLWLLKTMGFAKPILGRVEQEFEEFNREVAEKLLSSGS